MRKSTVVFVFVLPFLVACCTFIVLAASIKSLHATAGVVYYPYFGSAAAIEASREMCTDWGWKDRYQEGANSDVIVSAIDLNGKKVSINFKTRLIHSRAITVTEAGSEFLPSEIATELARRIGVPSESVRRNTMHALALITTAWLGLCAWSMPR